MHGGVAVPDAFQEPLLLGQMMVGDQKIEGGLFQGLQGFGHRRHYGELLQPAKADDGRKEIPAPVFGIHYQDPRPAFHDVTPHPGDSLKDVQQLIY